MTALNDTNALPANAKPAAQAAANGDPMAGLAPTIGADWQPDWDPTDWDQLAPKLEALAGLPVETTEQLEAFLAAYGQLHATVQQTLSTTSVRHACHTDVDAVEKAFLHAVRNIEPKLAQWHDTLNRKALASPAIDQLPDNWVVVVRNWQADVDLFRETNLPLHTQCTELATAYDKLGGEMLVDWQGEKTTLQQLVKHEASQDRSTREQAFLLGANRRLQDAEAIGQIYQKQVATRHQIATNAGFDNYRDYAMKDRKRFDYGTAECEAFHEAIKTICVPLVKKLDEAKRQAMGVETLKPWDYMADPHGTDLSPFDPSDADGFVAKAVDVATDVEPWMGEHLSRLQPGRNLDLLTRKGKRAGGFQASLPGIGEPFIFMNAAGTPQDVLTLLHEAGHAFHYQLAQATQPSVFMHPTAIEFAEVASMSMELLALEHLGHFYSNAQDQKQAQREQLEHIVRMLPWIATIDAFQHAVYTNLDAGLTGWQQTWDELTATYGTRHGGVLVDWTGLEDAKAMYWHRQLHLFHLPFYYIEYGIAQVGALQMWLNAKQNPMAAHAAYRHALSLGNTQTLPALFEAAGLRFDFTQETLAPLIQAVETALEELTDA